MVKLNILLGVLIDGLTSTTDGKMINHTNIHLYLCEDSQ